MNKGIWSGLCDFYHIHFLWIELLIALVMAGAFWAFAEVYLTNEVVAASLKTIRQPLYAGIMSLAASLLGFVIASVPIILGFGQLGRMRVVRESGHYPQVFQIFFQAMYWLSFAIVWAIIGIIADTDAAPRAPIAYIMVFFFLALVFRVLRCIWVLKKITNIAIADGTSTPN